MKSSSLFEEKYIFQTVPLVYITNKDFIKLSNDDLVFYVNIVASYGICNTNIKHISPETNIFFSYKNISCGIFSNFEF